ncbi:MAG: DUF1571 domain-containing protein [Pirellulales bacterium]
MLTMFTPARCWTVAICVAFSTFAAWPAIGQEQNQLSQPIYRVANETAAQPVAQSPQAPAAAPQPTVTPQSLFDLTKQGEEHPLAPYIRVCKSCLENIDQNVRDYSCTLVKQERVDGELGEKQNISMKVRQDPFSVYMRFLNPFQGREVLFVNGQNNNEMFVLEAGWKRTVLGKMSFSPDNAIVMRGQKYPITRVGIHNLLTSLIKYGESELQYAECEVTSNPDVKITGRSTTMIQVVHPIPRQNFRAHITRLFLDNELRVPVHYDAYQWPDKPGAQPPLEESYTYANLKLNNGFTARDFDSENPEIFRP